MGTFSSKRRVATTNRGYASLVFVISLIASGSTFVSLLLRQLVHPRLMHELAAYTDNLER
jgi:hypothetical protein